MANGGQGAANRIGRRTLATITIVGLTAGCASRPAVSSRPVKSLVPPPTITTAPAAPSSGANIQLPLDAYGAGTAEQEGVITKADDLLTQQCMRSKGFQYSAQPVGVGSPASKTVGEPYGPYGINDPAQAARYGYSVPSGSSTANLAANPALARSLSFSAQLQDHGASYMVALYGTAAPQQLADKHPRGCIDASAKIADPAYGTVDRSLVSELAQESVQRTEADSRVIQVESRWSTCMAAQGFQYQTPSDAQMAPWPAAPSHEEIQVAEADVTCKGKTNLPGIWLAVEAGYQRELIQQNAADLSQIKQDFGVLIRQAEKVLQDNTQGPAR